MYSDFENDDGGICRHVSDSIVGRHAVNYWRIVNSWNPDWRENGYFRIRFGEGGVDDSVVASSADATYSKMSPSPGPSPHSAADGVDVHCFRVCRETRHLHRDQLPELRNKWHVLIVKLQQR